MTKHLHYPKNLPKLSSLINGDAVFCDNCTVYGTIRVEGTTTWVDWQDGKHTVLTEELCDEV